MQNPEYRKIGPAVSALKEANELLKIIRSTDDKQIVFELIHNAERAIVTGTDCVSYTYLSFCLVSKLPKIQSLRFRSDQLKDIMSAISKTIKVPLKYTKYADKLARGLDPSAPETYDENGA